MKSKIILLLVCMAATAVLPSCGSKASSSESLVENTTAAETEAEEYDFVGPLESDEILIVKANAKSYALLASTEKCYDFSSDGGYKLKDGVTSEEAQDLARIYQGLYFATDRYITAHMTCDPEAYIDSIYPANLARKAKTTSSYEEFAEEFTSIYNGSITNGLNIELLSLDIEIGEKLTGSEIEDAETYYRDMAHSLSVSGLPPEISEGYFFSAIAKAGTNNADATQAYNLIAVNFGNEVWKIVESGTENLT